MAGMAGLKMTLEKANAFSQLTIIFRVRVFYDLERKAVVNENNLRLLIVEDSENDTILLLAELERKGYTPVHHRVETKRDFLAALRDHSWDAIIADYALPQFSGPEALKLFRQQKLDIPFLMVSGIYGEDMAVAMMKAGADDTS